MVFSTFNVGAFWGMICMELLCDAHPHIIVFADNAGVIVNPKGEMKGKYSIWYSSNSIHIDVSFIKK